MEERLETADHLELVDYLRLIRRRKWTVISVFVIAVATSSAVSFLQTPIYRSSADLLLQPRSTESIFDPSVVRNFASGDSAPTEIRVLNSEPVRDLVREAIGTAPAIKATNPNQTDFIVVAAESPDPIDAARIANAYADAYSEFRRRQAVSDLEEAAKNLEAQVAELNTQIDSVKAAVIASGGAAAAAKAGTDPAQALVQQRDLFVSRLGQIRLAIKQKTGGVQVVTKATPNRNPVRPTPVRTGVIAAVMGIILGGGLAFLRDFLDDSIRSKEDVERAMRGVPLLGLIPALGGWKDKNTPFVVTREEPKSPTAEAYRSLRTSVQFLGVERRLQVIQVTSASPGEGKSTTVANLAVALARAGQRVVVVCCDLRRPRIHHFFGVDNVVGLTSVVLGEIPVEQALQIGIDSEGVRVLASGPIPPNPSEILAGVRMGAILDTLRGLADVILIDCPPVLPVTDAAVLASRVDGTLIVVDAGETGNKELQRAHEILRQVSAPVLGSILNGVSETGAYGYSYKYRERYEPDPAPSSKRPKERLRT